MTTRGLLVQLPSLSCSFATLPSLSEVNNHSILPLPHQPAFPAVRPRDQIHTDAPLELQTLSLQFHSHANS